MSQIIQNIRVNTNPNISTDFEILKVSLESTKVRLKRIDLSGNPTSYTININRDSSSNHITPGFLRKDYQYHYLETLDNGQSYLRRTFWNGVVDTDYNVLVSVTHHDPDLDITSTDVSNTVIIPITSDPSNNIIDYFALAGEVDFVNLVYGFVQIYSLTGSLLSTKISETTKYRRGTYHPPTGYLYLSGISLDSLYFGLESYQIIYGHTDTSNNLNSHFQIERDLSKNVLPQPPTAEISSYILSDPDELLLVSDITNNMNLFVAGRGYNSESNSESKYIPWLYIITISNTIDSTTTIPSCLLYTSPSPRD